MADNIDFEGFQGEDWILPDTIDRGVTNIAGWAVAFTIMRSSDNAVLVTLTTAGGGVVLTTPASGLLTVVVPAAQTAVLPAGEYRYDVARTNSGSKVVLTWGKVTVRKTSAFR